MLLNVKVRQAGRQTDRQTDRQTERRVDNTVVTDILLKSKGNYSTVQTHPRYIDATFGNDKCLIIYTFYKVLVHSPFARADVDGKQK